MGKLWNGNMNSTAADTSSDFDDIFPALVKCFGVIICGYFAGRANLISETEMKGISTFVGKFALPAVVFMALAELDFSMVNWWFLFCILITKIILFFFVGVVTLLAVRPINYSRVGLYGVFCTQSNDFAIGYPIVLSLYKNTHPEYVNYLYLVAPINFVIVTPIAISLLELSKLQQSNLELTVNSSDSMTNYKRRLKILSYIVQNIAQNPFVFMSALGILWNLCFNGQVTPYVAGIMDLFSQAFISSMLFLTGLSMVGKLYKLRGKLLLIPGILIFAKLIMFPLLLREVVSLVAPGANSTETSDFTSYGFLYGTFPTANAVLVFAIQYSVDVDIIASSVVACTFISAPIMFVSAKMVMITKTAAYQPLLVDYIFDIGLVGIIASVWLLLIFAITKRMNKLPHTVTACFIISQTIACVGGILFTYNSSNVWMKYLQFVFWRAGIYSTRIWTVLLSITLLFLECRSLCFVLRLLPLFVLCGWGIPMLLTTILALVGDLNYNLTPTINNKPWAIVQIFVLIICFTVTIGCLILQQRFRKRNAQYVNLAREIDSTIDDDAEPEAETSANSPLKTSQKCYGSLPTIKEGCGEDNGPLDIEDLINDQGISNTEGLMLIQEESPSDTRSCPSQLCCAGNSSSRCDSLKRQYEEPINDDVELIEEEPGDHDPQILRHVVLLIFLLGSMFVSIAFTIWSLVVNESVAGIYVEMEFLEITLTLGQSIIAFPFFGFDVKDIVLLVTRYWRRICHRSNKLVLPALDELNSETKHICDQFSTHHFEKCKRDIAVDKRWRFKIYRNVFSGTRFVGWLIEIGLARDRVEAVHYARHLIEGRVLRHVNGIYHFYDRNLLYTFS